MKIIDLKVNQIEEPMGYDFSFLTLSWKVTESTAHYSEEVRVCIWEEGKEELYFDSGRLKGYRKCLYQVKTKLAPRTRYTWQVFVKDDSGNTAASKIEWFETGKQEEGWEARWISPKQETEQMPVLYREFQLNQVPQKARMYLYGAGLYELYVNGEKASDEYLQPGYHSYDLRMEYQTYDISNLLQVGDNKVEILLGEGWYKGRFGFDGDYKELYGKRKKCIGELYISLQDGTVEKILTDKHWKCKTSNILSNNIYDGEWIDDTRPTEYITIEELLDDAELLVERTNPPIRITESFLSVTRQWQEDGSLLLDFGESVTGWVSFQGIMLKGQHIRLYYGEVLQNGKFYRDNLRTAKAEFCYVSDGLEKQVRPHFTYYGFRYVRVEGLQTSQKMEFVANRLMSDIKQTGNIETANEQVNQLFTNTLRSQKCNFLDIPTDCPQRDERMGWTGDVAIFAPTACFHMNSGAFFRHYTKSLHEEQKQEKGQIPFFAPKPKVKAEENTNLFYITGGACGWGDVATILPWTLYEYYGDMALLREQYPMMCDWVDYITNRTKENAVPYLWQNDMQLGDWLALDNGNIHNPIGKTDSNMLASAYYYYSAKLCAKAAEELKDERADELKELVANIRQAFLAFYYDTKGELTTEVTQTACAFLLFLELYPAGGDHYLVEKLTGLLEENKGKLNTGFIGTPVLCPALSSYGKNTMAYDLLLNKEYPGWLFEVGMGATTIWERWNSMNGDGSVSDTGMNSFNHYAYGSIAEWMYRYMCGFSPSMNQEICMRIKPMPDKRLQKVEGSWESIYGLFESAWKYENGTYFYRITIPFNAKANVELSQGEHHLLEAGTYYFEEKEKNLDNSMTKNYTA